MSEISHNLSTILLNLTDILSKINSQSSKIQRQKFIKEPTMTYSQFLEDILNQIDLYAIDAKRTYFNIREDLYLILELSHFDNVSIKTFQHISSKKVIHRTPQNLSKRYYEFSAKISQKELKKICNWIQTYGLSGYLRMPQNKLVISKQQITKSAIKRQRPASLNKLSQKTELLSKTQYSNTFQLNDILLKYSKIVEIPVKELLVKLDEVSGDLMALDNYIESKNSRLLWNSTEDQILKKGGLELEILKSYKGAKQIEKRCKFLGYE